jgi:hypothetical protein
MPSTGVRLTAGIHEKGLKKRSPDVATRGWGAHPDPGIVTPALTRFTGLQIQIRKLPPIIGRKLPIRDVWDGTFICRFVAARRVTEYLAKTSLRVAS